MANEFYKPLSSVTVKSIDHKNVQGTPVPDKNAPFKRGPIPFFSQVTINPEKMLDTSVGNMIQISESHGRSSLLHTGRENSVIFSDEYGNIYSAINSKGGSFENPRIVSVIEGGVRIWGLEESTSTARVLRASDVMRRAGIETDYIIRVLEPTMVPYDGSFITLPEFKKKLFDRVTDDHSSGNSWDEEDLAKLPFNLLNTTVFITIRGVQVAERIEDLKRAEDADELERFLKPAFLYAKVRDGVDLDPSNNEDIKDYFTNHFPKKIATNMAKLHNTGLKHTQISDHNINLAGALIDNDGVEGPALELGDAENTQKELIENSFDGFEHALMMNTRKLRFFGPDELKTALRNYVSTYIEVRGFKNDVLAHAPELFQILVNTQLQGHPDLWNEWADTVLEELGWKFNTQETKATAIQSLREAGDWNIRKFLQPAIDAAEKEHQEMLGGIPASELFVNIAMFRVKNRPLQELLPEHFKDFQFARAIRYIDDSFGDSLGTLTTQLGEDVVVYIRILLAETKAQNLLAQMEDPDWSKIQRDLFSKLYDTEYRSSDSRVNAAAKEVFEETDALVLIKDGEPVFCANGVPFERFVKMTQIFSPTHPIDAVLAEDDLIFSSIPTRGYKKSIIAFTDGRLTDFDTKADDGDVIEFNGNMIPPFGFGEILTGNNIIEGASYLGTIDIDRGTGEFKTTLKTTMTEEQILSVLGSENGNRITFFR